MRKIQEFIPNFAKQFLSAKGGSTAIIFALSATTLLTAAGAGLDLARAMMVKSRLAGALDAAALAVGTTNGFDDKQLETLANKFFDANFPQTEGEVGTHGSVKVNREDPQHIKLEVSGSMPTSLLQIIGVKNLDFTVTNEVTRAVTKLRVALVLDNTGSMSQTDNTGTSKISALKTATHQLLTQLKSAAVNAGDVQVAIVPFSLDVKLGTAVADKDWISWKDFDSGPPNSMPSKDYGPQGKYTACPYAANTSPYGYGCKSGPANNASATTNIPANGNICPGMDGGKYNTGRGGHFYNGCYTSENAVCTKKNGITTCTYTHKWVANAHSTWTGCFMDREQNYDTNSNTPWAGTPATLFPAENNEYCPPVTVTGLGYDWSSLNTKVDQMTPNGSTNQTIGLVWGWQALTTGNPLNAPAQDPTIQNVIVLLSDGMNTQDRWYGDGSNTSSSVDNRMAIACANAKQAQVKIYTVLVMSGNSSTLQGCATDPQKYFSLNTAGAMVTAFNTIGTELANLHLSH